MSVKIMALEAENVKRIKAVALTPLPTGLTLVGGNNNQGKTSVLDALAWALGGDRFRPDAAVRDGALAPAHLKVTLSNGVVVERKGKNASLTVTDPTGRRSGQQLLNAFVEPLALDLPRFMDATDKEKRPTSCCASSASAPSCTPGIWRSRRCTISAPSPASWQARKSTLPRNCSPTRTPRSSRSAPPTSSGSSRISLPATARTSASGRSWQALRKRRSCWHSVCSC